MKTLPLFLLALVACSSDDDAPEAPRPETLFESLTPPTPNKLRGIWGRTQRDEKGTTELRIEFLEGYVVGGARCVPPTQDKSLIAGKASPAEITGLDDTKGTVVIKETISFSKNENGLSCAASIASAARFEFTVTGPKLTLAVPNSTVTTSFDKISD